MALGESLGRMACALLGSAPQRLQVDVWGLDESLRAPVTVAVLKGLLTPFLGEAVNYVNAERMAESRGIEVTRTTHSARGDYPQLVDVTLSGGGKSVELGGTLFGDHDPRVVSFEELSPGVPARGEPPGAGTPGGKPPKRTTRRSRSPNRVPSSSTVSAAAQGHAHEARIVRRRPCGSSAPPRCRAPRRAARR